MLSRKLIVLSWGLFFASFPVHARSEKSRIELSDRAVEGRIDRPKGEGPHPLLVLVAGADDAIGDPLYEKIVAAAVAQGFVTYRLDWSFKAKRGKPSEGLALETEELGIVINQMMGSRMMKQFEVDLAKVALLAKGLGAKVAMIPDSGGTGEKIKATLLLHPTCETAANSFASLYAPFLGAKTPRMIVAARAGACPIPQIYAAAKDFGENVALFTPEGKSPDATAAATAEWLRGLGWSTEKGAAKKTNLKKHVHEAQAAGTHP